MSLADGRRQVWLHALLMAASGRVKQPRIAY
jgi:hypothetical protein